MERKECVCRGEFTPMKFIKHGLIAIIGLTLILVFGGSYLLPIMLAQYWYVMVFAIVVGLIADSLVWTFVVILGSFLLMEYLRSGFMYADPLIWILSLGYLNYFFFLSLLYVGFGFFVGVLSRQTIDWIWCRYTCATESKVE